MDLYQLTKTFLPLDSEVQVNICQKILFLHQLTYNMTTRQIVHWITSSIHENSKLITWGEHVVYRNCFWHSKQFLYTTCYPPCFAKRRASDKDLPVLHNAMKWFIMEHSFSLHYILYLRHYITNGLYIFYPFFQCSL